MKGGDKMNLEKEDWYVIIGVLMWLIERIEHHIETKEKKKTFKNKHKHSK